MTTPIIYDFGAINTVKEGGRPGTLAELIAEDQAAWARYRAAPLDDLDERQRLADDAGALTHEVEAVIPDNIADCIRLLEWDCEGNETTQVPQNVITALRAIAARETGAPVPEAPIVRLFREYLVAERQAYEIEKTRSDDDPECEAAWRVALDLDAQILATPATDFPSLAVKAYMTLHDEYHGDLTLASGLEPPDDGGGPPQAGLSLARDISRILPDLLGPLCANFIAAEEETKISDCVENQEKLTREQVEFVETMVKYNPKYAWVVPFLECRAVAGDLGLVTHERTGLDSFTFNERRLIVTAVRLCPKYSHVTLPNEWIAEVDAYDKSDEGRAEDRRFREAWKAIKQERTPG